MENNTFYTNEYCEHITEYEKKKQTFLYYTAYANILF